MIRILLVILVSVLYISEVQAQSHLHTDYASIPDPTKQPLVLLDGEQYLDPEFMHSIDANTIQNLEILKGDDVQSYVDKYGVLALNGIIVYQTKSFVAKGWYNRFAKHQLEINNILQQANFDYKDYRVFVNDELLDNGNLQTWEPLLENKQITHVGFQSIGFGEEKGEIRVVCKAQDEEK
ncbi:hypothetical protein [Labilibaculum euxinus]